MYPSVNVFAVILLPLLVSPSLAAQEPAPAQPNALELLTKADAYRNFKGKSFTFDLTLNSMEPEKDDKIFTLNVEILNPHTSLVIYDQPTSERGKALLMSENNLWFHSPHSRKPIRITPQQRLLGEASNGDVASTDFSGDYMPSYLGADAINDVAYHKLELVAKPDSLATYSKLHLWIRSDNHKPYKADFFANTGKLLKTAFYQRYEKLPYLGDKEQLTAILIVNPLSEGKQTLMEYADFQVAELSSSRFTTSGLRRLR